MGLTAVQATARLDDIHSVADLSALMGQLDVSERQVTLRYSCPTCPVIPAVIPLALPPHQVQRDGGRFLGRHPRGGRSRDRF